ncbi:MAG TPA: hypothetical protein VKC62_04155 [Gaiellaceae bacterium]|nr:hypothetical protein [Gaiellaceae bacterium]
MANHTARLYALALSLVAFFLAWAVVAARPWATPSADPRLHALSVRAAELRREAKLVNEIVALRAKASAPARASSPAAAAAVRVVNLPPVTITRTS